MVVSFSRHSSFQTESRLRRVSMVITKNLLFSERKKGFEIGAYQNLSHKISTKGYLSNRRLETPALLSFKQYYKGWNKTLVWTSIYMFNKLMARQKPLRIIRTLLLFVLECIFNRLKFSTLHFKHLNEDSLKIKYRFRVNQHFCYSSIHKCWGK